MNLKTEDYLTYDEIKQPIKSEHTHDKSTIVCNKLIGQSIALYSMMMNCTYCSLIKKSVNA
jgi:hypothetical protein